MTSLALDSAAVATTVERAIAGDELAFARLVGAYHLDLVRVTRGYPRRRGSFTQVLMSQG